MCSWVGVGLFDWQAWCLMDDGWSHFIVFFFFPHWAVKIIPVKSSIQRRLRISIYMSVCACVVCLLPHLRYRERNHGVCVTERSAGINSGATHIFKLDGKTKNCLQTLMLSSQKCFFLIVLTAGNWNWGLAFSMLGSSCDFWFTVYRVNHVHMSSSGVVLCLNKLVTPFCFHSVSFMSSGGFFSS